MSSTIAAAGAHAPSRRHPRRPGPPSGASTSVSAWRSRSLCSSASRVRSSFERGIRPGPPPMARPRAFSICTGRSLRSGICSSRSRLHSSRRDAWPGTGVWGLAGAALAAVMVVLGILASLVAARPAHRLHRYPGSSAPVPVVPLAAIGLFGAFVTLAVAAATRYASAQALHADGVDRHAGSRSRSLALRIHERFVADSLLRHAEPDDRSVPRAAVPVGHQIAWPITPGALCGAPWPSSPSTCCGCRSRRPPAGRPSRAGPFNSWGSSSNGRLRLKAEATHVARSIAIPYSSSPPRCR